MRRIVATSMLAVLAVLAVPAGAAPLRAGIEVDTHAPGPAPFGGNFRIQCAWSHARPDDPIVSPGQPGAAHLHMFLGNPDADAHSTTESLRTAEDSTCNGGALNGSSYWVPALLDGQGELVEPLPANIYYKSGAIDQRVVQPVPAGLRMIAGSASGSPDTPNRTVDTLRWSCISWTIRGFEDFSDHIPSCAPGDTVVFTLIFPQCWNGRDLDAPDHASHMAHAVYDEATATLHCPESHPVGLPEITYNFDFPVPEGGTEGWHLSSDTYDWRTHGGGYSGHADWWMAWDDEVVETWTRHCINEGRDCSGGQLGDGTRLTWFHEGAETIERGDGAGGHDGAHGNDQPQEPLHDIVGNTHEDSIRQVVDAEIATGFADGSWRPARDVTRGQLATFLSRALDLPAGDVEVPVDVAGTTHAAAVASVLAAGVAGGFGDGTYRPGVPVSRGQLASMLNRALDLGPPSSDAPEFADLGDGPHRNAIRALAEAGVLSGVSPTRFAPDRVVTRAQLASFLVGAGLA